MTGHRPAGMAPYGHGFWVFSDLNEARTWTARLIGLIRLLLAVAVIYFELLAFGDVWWGTFSEAYGHLVMGGICMGLILAGGRLMIRSDDRRRR